MRIQQEWLIKLQIYLLKKIEFSEIRKYNWKDYQVHIENDDHSQAYKPNMDKDNGTLISLNIEVTK